MSEIGAGAGSSYPSTKDTNDSPERNGNVAHASVINDTNSAIIAIESSLGINPQGTKTTVIENIAIEHTLAGIHKTITVGGVSMTATPTANAPAMFNASGRMLGCNLPMTQERSNVSSQAGDTATSTVQFTNVRVGDRILFSCVGSSTSVTTSFLLWANAGSYGYWGTSGVSYISSQGIPIGAYSNCSLMAVWVVTANIPTLNMNAVAQSDSAAGVTVSNCYAFILKRT